MTRWKLHLGSTILILVSLGFALVAAELFVRWYDGYQILHFYLKKSQHEQHDRQKNRSFSNELSQQQLRDHLQSVPLASGVSTKWFYQNPPDYPNRAPFPHPDIARRLALAPPSHSFEASYVWNYFFVKNQLCQKPRHYKKWLNYFYFHPQHQLYVYKPHNESIHPSYRFYPNRTHPVGLVINNYGFRGHNLALKKPKDTIRLAFAGASTTISSEGTPYTYPELVEYWLNLWGQQNHYPYQIEVMNLGRSGIASPDIAEVIKNEALPLNPDYVFYYEGSNQFYPKEFITFKDVRHLKGKPKATFVVKPIEQFSALATRYYQMLRASAIKSGAEPKKPSYTVDWPNDLDENDPDIFYPELPVKLNQILADFDTIREATEKQRSAFVPMTFVWLPTAGMRLDLPRQAAIYTYLNHTNWPFSYQWIRRMADFQNRVIKNYAKNYQLDIIDVDATMPKDPNLFTDAIHNTDLGVRIRAWVVFQQIVELLAKNKNRPPVELAQTLPMDNLTTNIFQLSKNEAEQLC